MSQHGTTSSWHVWRRSDGYVNASIGRLPADWTSPSGEVTFTELLVTDDWDAVVAAINDARLDAIMREGMTRDPEEGGPRDPAIGPHPRFLEMDARREELERMADVLRPHAPHLSEEELLAACKAGQTYLAALEALGTLDPAAASLAATLRDHFGRTTP